MRFLKSLKSQGNYTAHVCIDARVLQRFSGLMTLGDASAFSRALMLGAGLLFQFSGCLSRLPRYSKTNCAEILS